MYKTANFVFLLVIINILFVTNCNARDWAVYSSENFTIYTDQSARKANNLLKEFEVFRKLVLGILGLENRPENSKMRIVVFNSGREYRAIAPRKNIIGFYHETTSGPRMIIGPDSETISKSEILYHEYIHYLFREHTNVIYPRWYDEGFAELLGATTFKRNKATIGAIPESRSNDIIHGQSISINELISPDPEQQDSRNYQARFYAYSWLFTHYLQISSFSENKELRQQNVDYLNRFRQGEDPLLAFEASFGVSTAEMDKKLIAYKNKPRLPVLLFDVQEYKGEIAKNELSQNEQIFLLADTAWELGEEEIALGYLKNIDATKKDAAEALSLAAILENHLDNIEVATQYALSAEKLNSENSIVLSNLSHWHWDNYLRSKEKKIDGRKDLSSAVSYGKKSIAIDPLELAAYEFVWDSLKELGNNEDALKTMAAAYKVAPSNSRINHTLANFLMKMGQPQLAKPFWERLLSWTHSSETRKEIQIILDNMKISNSDSNIYESRNNPSEN